ncbi:uncharacterized protein KIAA1143 homolog [Cephus cinctus]|uniref:Uncharacterized protein KIAA1143 homolog n=1 Tax=Cephus cinctus TaxID=211228 RepID=A0AAJ7BI26_CEPCN|nr:uncharacterized protein KIAA1143 homolog [Cephus cinctus]
MSKRKHNISYIKPEEPKFLREMKERIGYKEGPTIETKREALPEDSDDEEQIRKEEEPTVVVLNSGDLTAEEADTFKHEKEQEEANAPADLNKRIIFRKNKTSTADIDPPSANGSSAKKSKKTKQKKTVLSFDEEEDSED